MNNYSWLGQVAAFKAGYDFKASSKLYIHTLGCSLIRNDAELFQSKAQTTTTCSYLKNLSSEKRTHLALHDSTITINTLRLCCAKLPE